MRPMEVPPLFQRVRRDYLRYCRENPVPPAIHHKLMFLSDCLLHLQEADEDQLDHDQLGELKQIDRDSQIKLFISIARCVMGHQPLDALRDRQAYIRKDGVFSRWHRCLISTTADGLKITQKEVTMMPFTELRISAGVKQRKKKYSFLLEIHKKLFMIGCLHEKGAVQIHEVLKQLIVDASKNKNNAVEEDVGVLESGILQNSFSRELDDSVEEADKTAETEDNGELAKMQDESSFKLEEYIKSGRILRHQFDSKVLKCFLLIEIPKTSNPNPCEQVLNIFMNFKEWNPEIDSYMMVSKPDADTYVIYEKYHKSGFMSLPRDFVMIKRAKKHNNDCFSLLEESAEHRDFPSEYLTVRGTVKRTSMFVARSTSTQRLVLLVTKVEVTGNDEDIAVATRYLRSYEKFPSYCQQKLILDAGERFFMFDAPKLKRPNVRKFMSLQDHVPKSPPTVPALTLRQLAPKYSDSPLTEQFAALIRNNQHWWHHLNHRYQFKPKEDKGEIVAKDRDYVFNKGQWRLNEDKEMIFANQAAIDAQKDVIKYILKQIGSNLLKGKSVMNMSLPVEIFDDRSILERTAESYGFAPLFLGKAGQCDDPIEQIKLVTLFMLSISLLQMKLEKPFNPVHGETFQGYLGGIPIYMEQVAHHPPITAYLIKCDTFQLYGSSTAVAKMHFNSVTGANVGVMHIRFPKTNTKIECYMPSVDVSGLLYGDRKLKIVHKMFIVCQAKQLLSQISFGNEKNGVYNWTRKDKLTSSSIVGGVFRAVPAFFERLKQTKRDSFEGVERKEVEQRLASIEGFWNGDVYFNGELARSVDNPLPYRLEYEQFPLASNSNYREDIIYKRMRKNDVANAKKEQLEESERRNRKLRGERNKH